MEKKTEKQVSEILDSLTPVLEAHNCSMELSAVKGNKVFIYCGGEGAVCENKCIEDVIKEKIPAIEVIFL